MDHHTAAKHPMMNSTRRANMRLLQIQLFNRSFVMGNSVNIYWLPFPMMNKSLCPWIRYDEQRRSYKKFRKPKRIQIYSSFTNSSDNTIHTIVENICPSVSWSGDLI